jgi:uncharacterized protein (DUF849 family)
MAKTPKIIVTCAITGAIHTPSMSPFLPVSPDQVAEASIGAAKAGAAIVHLHARNPEPANQTTVQALSPPCCRKLNGRPT